LFGVLLGLIQMIAPFFSPIAASRVDLQLMSHSLNFEHPLLSAYRRLNDLILHLFLVVAVAATPKLSKIFNIIIGLLSILNHISDISIALHIIVVVPVVVHVAPFATVVLNDWLLELELVLEADLTQSGDE
jgi:hypothetical protein